MRIMGLDYGSKRIGIALSDEMGWTAQGLMTLQRKGIEEDLRALSALVRKYAVERMVIGLPLNMNGSVGPQAREVLDLSRKLEAVLGIPVSTWDERLSSQAAEKILLLADTSRRKRKRHIDKVAATLILQGYLDFLSSQTRQRE